MNFQRTHLVVPTHDYSLAVQQALLCLGDRHLRAVPVNSLCRTSRIRPASLALTQRQVPSTCGGPLSLSSAEVTPNGGLWKRLPKRSFKEQHDVKGVAHNRKR
jgi:hypothetical protein